MNDNVIPFQKNEEENESCCSKCDLAHEYTLFVLEAVNNGSYDDVFGLIREVVEESSKQTIIEFLHSEIENNIKILDHLHGYCDCDGDCHCDDEE